MHFFAMYSIGEYVVNFDFVVSLATWVVSIVNFLEALVLRAHL